MNEAGGPVSDPTTWLQGEVEHVGGRARLRRVSAAELAVEDRSAFAHGLIQAGMAPAECVSALEVRDGVARSIASLDDRYSTIARAAWRCSSPLEAVAIATERRVAFRRLDEWIEDRTFDVHAATTHVVRIPLFVVAAPDVAGCRSALSPDGKVRDQLSWRLQLHGTGAGTGMSLHVMTTCRVTALSGEAKALFVSVTLTVEEVTVRHHGRVIGHGTQVAFGESSAVQGPHVLRLAPETSPRLGVERHAYPLAPYRSGGVRVCERFESRGPRQWRFAVEAFGVRSTFVASVSAMRALPLMFDLAAGQNYSLHDLANADGIGWSMH